VSTSKLCAKCRIFAYCLGELVEETGYSFEFFSCLACGRIIHIHTQRSVAKCSQVCEKLVQKARARAERAWEFAQSNGSKSNGYRSLTPFICTRPECQARKREIVQRCAQEAGELSYVFAWGEKMRIYD